MWPKSNTAGRIHDTHGFAAICDLSCVLHRFNFDWEASEDTHEARLHEGSVLFGRGTIAGIDRRAQREDAARREQQLLSDMRRARGDRTTAADIKADMARASRASHIDDDPVHPHLPCKLSLRLAVTAPSVFHRQCVFACTL